MMGTEPARWLDKAAEAGAMRGERLFVDCRAEGTPRPSVTITNGYNHLFKGPPSFLLNMRRMVMRCADGRFAVADERLTIDPVQEADEGMAVLCTAAQVFPSEGITNVQTKKVRISVWRKTPFPSPFFSNWDIYGARNIFTPLKTILREGRFLVLVSFAYFLASLRSYELWILCQWRRRWQRRSWSTTGSWGGAGGWGAAWSGPGRPSPPGPSSRARISSNQMGPSTASSRRQTAPLPSST